MKQKITLKYNMVCECHLISDPLYHHTWSCLHHYNYLEAIFTAERIFAENPNDESIYLLATCLYRSNGPKQARTFLLSQDSSSAKCRYLLAKCCMDIGNNAEAESTLLGTTPELDNPAAVAAFYKEIAPFVLQMLADIYKQSERRKSAISYLKKCLELNPLSWISFTSLVDLHDNVDSADVFSLPKGVVLNNQSCLRALSNKINIGEISHPNCPSKKRTDIHDSQEDLSVSRENVNPKCEKKFIDDVNSSDLMHVSETQIQCSFNSTTLPHVHTNSVIEHLCNNLLPECNIIQANVQSRQKIFAPKSFKKDREEMEIEPTKPLFGDTSLSSLSSMYGLVPVFNVRPGEPIDSVNTRHNNTNSPIIHQNYSHNPRKHRNTNRRSALSSARIIENTTLIGASKYEKTHPTVTSSSLSPVVQSDNLNYSTIPSLPISPLISNQDIIVDANPVPQSNNCGQQMFRSVDVKPLAPRTRLQVAKAAAAQKSSFKKEHVNLSEDCCSKTTVESDTRLRSALYYLQLLINMGRAYKYIRNYKLTEAVSQIKQLPKHHSETALVSSWMAKAYIEMNDKSQACAILTASFKNEPWQLHGVTLFSAILWMLNKEKELLSLANDMLEMDRESPEVWCVFGNCMSLNKENEIALRFFQRVVQLNTNYAYGYMLLGHEYFCQDELDKAMSSYRRALDLDSHNYQASYCIASVYQRQDNYVESEKILKEALKIFPDSYILLTNLAIVRSKLKQNFEPDAALDLLEKACRLYPNEPLCRFHKASILYHSGRFNDALTDLKLLDSVKEARIFLLMSMIYKQMGEMNKAMAYNTWATDLDPKCTNDSFMLDRTFCSNSGLIGISDQNNAPMSSLNAGFLPSVRHNSESMQEDVASNNNNNNNNNNHHIAYDLLEAD